MPIEDLNDLDLRHDILRFTGPEPYLHGLYVPKLLEYPQQKRKLKQTSLLFRPNPFINERELLGLEGRELVGLEGRLQKTVVTDEVNYPTPVLKKSPKTVV